MARASLKEQLIESGVQTLHRGGYHHVGVRAIVADAKVPQGSFTNHFASKEAFALEVVSRYFESILEVVDRTLLDEARSPLDRLRSYFETIGGLLAEREWRHGCLIGNMSLEATEQSEVIRERLDAIFAEWTAPFAVAIRAGQVSGDIRADLDPDETAEFLLSAWHGAMLRMKVERGPRALEAFTRLVFTTVLVAPAEAR
ncbi:MAG: TetR family transcriptional regulator C-terminal domain-containing protein [Umezawaea sp.]